MEGLKACSAPAEDSGNPMSSSGLHGPRTRVHEHAHEHTCIHTTLKGKTKSFSKGVPLQQVNDKVYKH